MVREITSKIVIFVRGSTNSIWNIMEIIKCHILVLALHWRVEKHPLGGQFHPLVHVTHVPDLVIEAHSFSQTKLQPTLLLRTTSR